MFVKRLILKALDLKPLFNSQESSAPECNRIALEAAKVRRRQRVDSKMSKILAQRWIGRKERRLRSNGAGE